MITLDEVVTDPDLAEPYTIIRTRGNFAPGGWEEVETKEINNFGTVAIARGNDLEMIPEADRVQGALTFYSAVPLFLQEEGTNGNWYRDRLRWKGDDYRILGVSPYDSRGYWKAYGVRMAGV